MCLNLIPIPSHRPSFSVTSDAYCTEIWNPKTCWSTNPVLSKLLTSVWPGLSVSLSGCTLTRSSPCGTEPLKSSWEPASTHAPSTSGQLVASSRKWQTKDRFSRYTSNACFQNKHKNCPIWTRNSAYRSVLSKWEFFIKMRASFLLSPFLHNSREDGGK